MTPFSTICSPFASFHENEQYAEWSIQHLLSLAGVVQRFGARQVESDRPRQRQSRQRGREDRGVGAPPPRDEVAPYFRWHPTSGRTLLPVAPYFRPHPTSGGTLLLADATHVSISQPLHQRLHVQRIRVGLKSRFRYTINEFLYFVGVSERW